jgi:hypothetical protein
MPRYTFVVFPIPRNSTPNKNIWNTVKVSHGFEHHQKIALDFASNIKCLPGIKAGGQQQPGKQRNKQNLKKTT